MEHNRTERIIQWNTQGISTARPDILKLIESYQPIIMAFQETHLANDCNIKLKPYNCISKQETFNRRQHGGIVIYIHDSCLYRRK